ncbi:hypothetical protein ACFVU3_14270 [Streptomyces sp. NPDC058052]
MNDSLSLAADILTILGALVGIALDARRARRETHRYDQGDEHPME